MTSFRFRLQAVLDWRAAQLEAEELRLRQLVEAGRRIGQDIADAEAAGLGEEVKVRGAGHVTGADLWTLAAFRDAARRQVRKLEEERRRQEGEIVQARERVALARRRCRLLERLKERRMAEWNEQNRRQLEEFAAEAFLARWRRH